MLLNRMRSARFLPAALLAPLLLSACAFQPDASWKKSAAAVPSDPAAAGAAVTPPGVLFGLRRDPGVDAARQDRLARLAGDPALLPTPREQRAARALALAELEIITRGGNIMYRPDGSASREEAVKYVASPGALTLEYDAAADLNDAGGIPHALLLVVYHLSDRAALDQLAGHEDGLRKLLEGGKFDESVKSARKHCIQPGASGTLRLARPDDGRVVALVAGYAEPAADTSLFVAEYGLGAWEATPDTMFHNIKKMYTPLPMRLMASFGGTAMAVRNTGRVFANTFDVQVFTEDQRRRHAIESFF